MPKPIIQIENISKAYRLGQAAVRHTTFREAVLAAMHAPLRRMRELGRPPKEHDSFWALQDVSFVVLQGEVIGIVGRNGAGKSTLLKVLSRITEPTRGQVRMRGRVASLLEVGTGFHPELTGRENIYLNGAVLGMSKSEIDRKFDEIVDFSGVELFLDTPVKRFSSGMYVRLAFAVAAHLEPEILIVDEVLAVGDAEFQRKCLGKMREVSSGQGRTVLFVSHNMPAVSALCERTVLLDQGRLLESGPTADVLRTYSARFQGAGEELRVGTAALRWLGIQNRSELDGLRIDGDICFDLGFESGALPINNLEVDCALFDEQERMTTHCRFKFVSEPFCVEPNTRFVVRYALRSPRLAPGAYHLTVYAASGATVLSWVEQVDACTVSAASPFSAGAVLDGVRGATVPEFSATVLTRSEGPHVASS